MRSCRSTWSRRAGDPERPLRHLAGFVRIEVPAGDEATATVELDRRAFASWLDGGWVVPPGEYVIHVGPHSRQLQRAGVVTA